jgi:hypothetical protein
MNVLASKKSWGIVSYELRQAEDGTAGREEPEEKCAKRESAEGRSCWEENG